MITLKQSVAAIQKKRFENRFSTSVTDLGVFCQSTKQSIVLDASNLTNNEVTFCSKRNTYVVINTTVYADRPCFASFCLNTSDYKTAARRRDVLLRANSFAIKDCYQGEDFNGFYSILCKVVAIEHSNSKIEYTPLFEQELKNYNFGLTWNDVSVTSEVFSSIKSSSVLQGVKNITREFCSDLGSLDPKFVALMRKQTATFFAFFILMTILFGIKESLKVTAFSCGLGFAGGIVKGAVDRNRKVKSFSN